MTRVGAKDRPGVLPTDIGTCLESPLMVQWTAPATGIAMCQNLIAIEEQLESAFGYKQTSSHPKSMSALPPTPDIPKPTLDFRF